MIDCRLIVLRGALHEAEIALRDSVLRGPQRRGRRPEDFERDRRSSHFIAIDAGRVVS